MLYIEAPTGIPSALVKGKKSVFLAGGITGCPDWQKEMVQALSHANLVLLNPRRKNFPMDDPNAAFEQIRWEHIGLRMVDAVLFWFCKDTLCPIVLYELGGRSLVVEQPIFVGIEPGYQRERDVVIQTSFVRPEVKIQDSVFGLANQVLEWVDGLPVKPLERKEPTGDDFA